MKVKTITDVCIVFMMLVVLLGVTKDAIVLAIRIEILRQRVVECAEDELLEILMLTNWRTTEGR